MAIGKHSPISLRFTLGIFPTYFFSNIMRDHLAPTNVILTLKQKLKNEFTLLLNTVAAYKRSLTALPWHNKSIFNNLLNANETFHAYPPGALQSTQAKNINLSFFMRQLYIMLILRAPISWHREKSIPQCISRLVVGVAIFTAIFICFIYQIPQGISFSKFLYFGVRKQLSNSQL